MSTTIFRDLDFVVTVNESNQILRNTSVVIADRKIVAIGDFAEVAQKYPAAEVDLPVCRGISDIEYL